MWSPRHQEYQNKEVDFIVERKNRLVAVEVKTSRTIDRIDSAGLRIVREEYSDLFHAGIVIYSGDTIKSLGDKLFALPAICLAR